MDGICMFVQFDRIINVAQKGNLIAFRTFPIRCISNECHPGQIYILFCIIMKIESISNQIILKSIQYGPFDFVALLQQLVSAFSISRKWTMLNGCYGIWRQDDCVNRIGILNYHCFFSCHFPISFTQTTATVMTNCIWIPVAAVHPLMAWQST